MKRFLRKLLLLLPRTRSFDVLYHLVYFLVAHRRVPRRDSGLFNDYLYFLKTSRGFDSALRQFVSDKDLVKIYYKGVLARELAPRTLKKFATMEEVLSGLPSTPCVIKPAHLSGCIYYSGHRDQLGSKELARIAGWFQTNIYRDISRERNYRDLTPSVICEELISNASDIRDYKIFCFGGKPRAIQVDTDRHSVHKRRMYTVGWQALPFAYNKPIAPIEEKPSSIGDALEIASQLARDFEFLRVDFYLTEGRVYLGELTSIPENAHGRFESREAEKTFSTLMFAAEP